MPNVLTHLAALLLALLRLLVTGGLAAALPVLGAQAAVLVETWARRVTPPLRRWARFALAPALACIAGLGLRAAWLAVFFHGPSQEPMAYWSIETFGVARWAMQWSLLAGLIQFAVVAIAGLRGRRVSPARTG